MSGGVPTFCRQTRVALTLVACIVPIHNPLSRWLSFARTEGPVVLKGSVLREWEGKSEGTPERRAIMGLAHGGKSSNQ